MKHLADEKYKQFNSKLLQTNFPLLGIPVPLIRKEATKRLQADNWKELINISPTYHEEVQLFSFIISKALITVEERFMYLEKQLAYFDNWQVVDGLVSSLKEAKKHPTLYWNWLQKLKRDESTYTQRFVIVMLFTYFHKEHLEEILKYYESIQTDEYYINMAIAWGISKLYLKDKTRITAFLASTYLDNWTYNKAIQKITELSTTSNEEKRIWKTKKRLSNNVKM